MKLQSNTFLFWPKSTWTNLPTIVLVTASTPHELTVALALTPVLQWSVLAQGRGSVESNGPPTPTAQNHSLSSPVNRHMSLGRERSAVLRTEQCPSDKQRLSHDFQSPRVNQLRYFGSGGNCKVSPKTEATMLSLWKGGLSFKQTRVLTD